MERSEKEELLKLLEEKERRVSGRKLFTYYPETGPLRREASIFQTIFYMLPQLLSAILVAVAKPQSFREFLFLLLQ